MRYLIGNWKSNKNFVETYTWFDDFAKIYKPVPDLTVVVAVPFPFLIEAQKKIQELSLEQVSLAAQDISPYPYGAYTGAISAPMVQAHIEYCIVGHSERRNYFAESHLEVSNKIDQLLAVGITPVLCLDEPYAQKQIAALEEKVFEKIIIAYEPLEAIGSGQPDDPEHTKNVAQLIRELLQTEATPIIYGGSTKPDNAGTYLKVEGISGLLPGGSSLKPHVFAEMTQAYL